MNVDTRARGAATDVLDAVDRMQRSPAGVHARAGSIDGFRAFEARRRRTQRVTAVAVAVAIAALGFAGLLRAFRSQPIPADQPAGTIAPGDLGRLELGWVGQAGAPPRSLAVVGEAVLVGVGGNGGHPSRVAVFDADCASSGGRCEPVRVIPSDLPVISIVRDGDTAVIVTVRRVTAFPAACLLDTGPCPASWNVEHSDAGPEAGIALHDGVLFWTEQRWGAATSRLVAYVEGEGPVLIAELRRLRFHEYLGGMTILGPSPPILAGDSVVVAADRLYAFPIACALDPSAPCQPRWRSPEPSRQRYLYTDPLSARDGLVFARKAGIPLSLPSRFPVDIFPVDCRLDGGVCEPLDRGYWPTPNDPLAVADDVVYEASGATLTARRFTCDANGCGAGGQPLWVGMLWDGPPGVPPVGETRPLAVGGSVFVAPLNGRHLFAFDARCGSGGERCEADWTYVTSGLIRTAPVVAGGRLLVALGNGEVLSFGPGDGGTPLGSIWIAAAVLGVVAGLAVINRRRTPRAMRPGRGREP